tara:strand:+ start:297 stop:488 length:192 start_codon:yes stop_codon:yes gene_type:complete
MNLKSLIHLLYYEGFVFHRKCYTQGKRIKKMAEAKERKSYFKLQSKLGIFERSNYLDFSLRSK